MDAGDVIALVIGLLSAGVAVWAVVVAHKANGRADKANKIAAEANGLATDANEIAGRALELQEQTLPPEWSDAISLEKDHVAFRNQSGRHIIVTNVDEVQAGPVLLNPVAGLPVRVENGDVLKLLAIYASTSDPGTVRIVWQFEGDVAVHATERHL